MRLGAHLEPIFCSKERPRDLNNQANPSYCRKKSRFCNFQLDPLSDLDLSRFLGPVGEVFGPQDGSKSLQDVSKRVEELSKSAQEGSKRVQELSKRLSRGLKSSPRGSQEVQRGLKRPPRALQERSKRPPGCQDSSKSSPRGWRIDFGADLGAILEQSLERFWSHVAAI